MRLERRTFPRKAGASQETRHLLVILETEAESKDVDWALGAEVPVTVTGVVGLADEFGEHYVRLEKFEGSPLLLGVAREMGDLLLQSFLHVSHGGPTRSQVEILLRRAGLLPEVPR